MDWKSKLTGLVTMIERLERKMFAIIVWVVAFVIIMVTLGNYPLLIGVAAWLLFVAASLQSLVVVVPKVTGLVMLNSITGILKAFGPGLHFKYPWEAAKEEDYFPLTLITAPHEEDYASKDGPLMHVKWSFQYMPNIKYLDAFVAVDHSTIDHGFAHIISGILSEVIGGMPAQEARTEVEKVQSKVLNELRNRPAIFKNQKVTLEEKLEWQYGIDFKLFAVADIDYSADYQEALSGRARMEVIKDTAIQLKKGLEGLTDKDAANFILVEKGKATKIIHEVTDLAEAANALGRGLRGLGKE